jgi:hypothetical protein
MLKMVIVMYVEMLEPLLSCVGKQKVQFPHIFALHHEGIKLNVMVEFVALLLNICEVTV